jgi:hypothetical protein
MLKRIILPFVVAIIAIGSLQCRHETDFTDFPANPGLPVPSATCSGDSVYFVNSVLPMIRSSCALSGCHDMETAEDGIILTDYYRIKITGGIKPGNSGSSRLYKVLSETGESRMPPSPFAEFTAEQKAIVARWIDQGAKYNYCTESCNPGNFEFGAHIFPIIASNCRGCHSGNAPSAGIRLDDYSTIKAAADNNSLYGSVAWLSGYTPMPDGGIKLSDCNITQIKNWIDNGAPNN